MLSNAYLLAKFRFDTAENERNFTEILPKTDIYRTDPAPPRKVDPPSPRVPSDLRSERGHMGDESLGEAEKNALLHWFAVWATADLETVARSSAEMLSEMDSF